MAPLVYYCHGQRKDTKIALTFDDGPNPHTTPQVLDILRDKGVNATFFLLGSAVEKYPNLVKRILDDGHEIGNHTFSHVIRDWLRAERIINRATGANPVYCRAPYLARSFYRNLDQKYLKSHQLIHFDVDSYDWKEDIKPNQVIKRTLLLVRNGSIIDFHDSSENRFDLKGRGEVLLESLSVIIEELKKRFQLVKISEIDLVPMQRENKERPNKRYPNVTQKVVLSYNGKILLLHHASGILDFPGGRLEYGESLLGGLNRELSEELDYNLDKLPAPIHVWNYISKDSTRHSVMIYYRHQLKQKPELVSPEGHDCLWLTRSELLDIGFDKPFVNILYRHE